MALIGLLLSLSVPRYFGHVDKAKEAVLRQDLHQMRDAIDKYFSDHDRYPDTLSVLVEGGYIRRIPVDPITEKDDTWVAIPPSTKDMGGVYDVHTGALGKSREGSDYASW